MTEPDPTNSTSDDADARLIAEVIALRCDLIRVIKQAERVLEVEGIKLESAIVTRRERRYNRRQETRRQE